MSLYPLGVRDRQTDCRRNVAVGASWNVRFQMSTTLAYFILITSSSKEQNGLSEEKRTLLFSRSYCWFRSRKLIPHLSAQSCLFRPRGKKCQKFSVFFLHNPTFSIFNHQWPLEKKAFIALLSSTLCEKNQPLHCQPFARIINHSLRSHNLH